MARIFRHEYTTTVRGRRVRRYTKNYYIEYRDEHGRKRRVPGYVDKIATERRATELEHAVILRLRGERPADRRDNNTPLAQHLADYSEAQHGRGVGEPHIETTAAALQRAFAGVGAIYPDDLERGRVESWLAEQRRAGLSVQTTNHYIKALRAMLRWMVADGRIPADPLAGIRRLNVETDRRKQRRALTGAEFSRLIMSTKKSRKRFRGFSGPDRARLYQVAAYTGLRRSELLSLTADSFDLAGRHPTVTVEARVSKHRRRDVVPLPKWLAIELRQWIERRDGRLWPAAHWMKTAIMLRRDLAAAKIPYTDGQGRVFDFHSLRGQYVTGLARAGVPLATAQKLARHSSPVTTSRHYLHLDMTDLAAAAEKLKRPK